MNTRGICGDLACSGLRDTSFINQSIYLLVEILERGDKRKVGVSPAGDTQMGNDATVVLGSQRVRLH